MTELARAHNRSAPLPKYWAIRITELLPIPYWQTCLIYGCAFFIVLLAALLATGADFANKTYIRGLVLMPLLAGYITALGPMVSQSANRMIIRLESSLRPGAPVSRFEKESHTLKVLQIAGFLDKWVIVTIYNTEDLAAVGRLGMSLAFFVSCALAFVGVIQIALDAPVGVLVMVFIMSLPGIYLVFFTLIHPARVIQRKVKAEKDKEKRRIASAINDNKALPVLGDTLGGIDLMDYKKRVYHLKEWPFDMITVRACGGFLLLPLVSWTCAATVTVFIRKMLM